jgi:hypothetical protein
MNPITQAVSLERSSVTQLARVTDASGAAVGPDDVTSIVVKIFNRDSASLVEAPTLAPADVFLDELTTDARWTIDATGFNFALPLTGAAFPGAGDYRVEIKVQPTDGGAYYIAYDLEILNLFSE